MFHGCRFGRSRRNRVVVQREGVTGIVVNGVETVTVKIVESDDASDERKKLVENVVGESDRRKDQLVDSIKLVDK